jgi:hypothetical protein
MGRKNRYGFFESFFDDPRDQNAIQRGIDFANEN